MNAAFMVLADWPGSSRTRVTTPSSDSSQRMVEGRAVVSMTDVSSEVSGGGSTGQTRSTMVAMPMPPPTHRVARP